METKYTSASHAFLAVQKEIRPIVKDSTNPHFKNKYFDINTLLAEVKPILNRHGLALTQLLTCIDGKIGMITRIMHPDSDTSIEGTTILPECPDAQKYGSAITYFRRYSLQSLLALEAEDDDGNDAKPKPAAAARPAPIPASKTIRDNDLPF